MRRFSTKKLLTVLLAAAVCTITATLVCRHYIVRGSPDELLSRADALAWNNEWIRATPLYAEAEKNFLRRGLFSKALYAHVSQLMVRAESDPIPPLLLELQKHLRLPQAQDPETYLRVLVILGMLESNYDAALARGTWKRVEEIAESRGHYLLMARAMGEQGLAAFLLGDVASAKKLVLRVWIAAKYLHDDAAHVRYASMYGGGLPELQRYDEAIRALDEVGYRMKVGLCAPAKEPRLSAATTKAAAMFRKVSEALISSTLLLISFIPNNRRLSANRDRLDSWELDI